MDNVIQFPLTTADTFGDKIAEAASAVQQILEPTSQPGDTPAERRRILNDIVHQHDRIGEVVERVRARSLLGEIGG